VTQEQLDQYFADWANLWKPPEQLPLSQWAEKNIVLSPEYSARTGPLQLYGWQKGILDSFTDPTVERIVLMCGTQLIKTLFIQAVTAYVIGAQPAPMLIVAPKEDDAETFSKERLEPMIRDCPVFEGKFSTKAKDRLNTTTFKRFPGGSISLVGAGAPGNAARRSICVAALDEVDKYGRDVGGEGDFVDLVYERLATFGSRKKLILACSPTKKHTSRIGRAYEQSDQRKPWVKCWHCNEWQVLSFFAHVKFDEGPRETRPETARIECTKCGARWNDVQRWAAVENADWRSAKPFRGTAGFWISHLYSPWKTTAEIVDRFLDAKDDRRAFQVFVNTNLAELWEEEGDTPEWEVLMGRRENYPHGEEAVVPMRALFLTAFVDVQEDRLEYEVVGWGRGKENWSLAYGVIRVQGESGKSLPSSSPELWAELDKVLAREYKHESGTTMPIMCMGIDTGFRPKPVYDFAKRHVQAAFNAAGMKVHAPRTVVPTKGSSTESLRLLAAVSKEDAARRRQGVRIVSIGTAYAKQELFDNLRLPRPVQGVPSPGYCHHPDYAEDYFRGLCSEKRVLHEDDSVSYEKIFPRNEPLDCKVGNRAMSAVFGIDRFSESHWGVLEKQLGITPVIPQVPKVETKPAPTDFNRNERPQSPNGPSQRPGVWFGGNRDGWFKR
jgi:phage terminase large subunit GpA-like protein